jgi:hypothetical protein
VRRPFRKKIFGCNRAKQKISNRNKISTSLAMYPYEC